jgi:photosystem II stability/assembly factor-like uncharacterized protein
VTPDEQELRRALDGRSGPPSPEFRARMSALSYDEKPMAGGLSVVALVVAATLAIVSIGVLFFARQAMTPQHSGPASTARLASPTPPPLRSPSPTQVFLPQTAQLSAPSADILWVYFAQGLLFRSTDRGDTWVQRSLPTQSLSSSANVTFVDDQHGWLATAGSPETQCNGDGTVIWQTTDGAATWKQVALVDGSGASASGVGLAQCKENLSFVDLTHGFLDAWDTNHQPTIYRTSDGGRTWVGTTLPDPPGFTTQAGGFSLRAGRVQRFGSTLLLIASDSQGGDFVYRSTDGGATWTPIAKVAVGTDNIALVTESRWLWLIPADQSLETTDAGKSWHHYSTDYSQAAPIAPVVIFGDAEVGYATVRASIQRTVDGGMHWLILKTPGT